MGRFSSHKSRKTINTQCNKLPLSSFPKSHLISNTLKAIESIASYSIYLSMLDGSTELQLVTTTENVYHIPLFSYLFIQRIYRQLAYTHTHTHGAWSFVCLAKSYDPPTIIIYWAPCVGHRKIYSKEKLYFYNDRKQNRQLPYCMCLWYTCNRWHANEGDTKNCVYRLFIDNFQIPFSNVLEMVDCLWFIGKHKSQHSLVKTIFKSTI